MRIPERMNLANIPTKIEIMGRLSRELGNFEIYVKRDDLTGCELSGNKARKLEYVLYDAIKNGADTLITCGGNQSNHARATAIVAARHGLKAFLVLRGEKPQIYDGNILLDKIAGAEIMHITEEEYKDVNKIMLDVAEKLRSKGHRPYIIPVGASYKVGAWGYINAVKEIKQQIDQLKLKIDYLIFASGSGGTQSGLLLGRKIYKLDTEILGINIGEDHDVLVEKIWKIMVDVKNEYAIDAKISKDEIRINSHYIGEGYAKNRLEEIEFIKFIAKLEGIILDPTYTCKALFGLVDMIKKGIFAEGTKFLFIHTGGIFSIFPKKDLF